MYYIGLDVHKKTISYCVKDAAGCVHQEGKIGSTRRELDAWVRTLPQPRSIAMEATMFSGWIYDHLLPHAEAVKVAHPLMLRAIAAAKKKNDRIDAGKIADCLRCDFLPECHMAPTAIRDRRRVLRYRHLLVRQMAQTRNRVSGLLMETGVEHNRSRLHKVGYFSEMLATSDEISDSIRPLLKLSREHIDRSMRMDAALLRSLEHVAMEMLRLAHGEHEKLVFDSMNHRAMRLEELRLAAGVAAERVRKTGNPYSFSPMSSRERRILHLALRDEADLHTESQGEAGHRCVVLYPKDYKPPKPVSRR